MFKRKGKKTWYFYFYQDGKRISKSTGQTVKYKAEKFAEKFLDGGEQAELRLKDFATDFFLWDRCGWIRRQHAKGRDFSHAVADCRRGHLVNYVIPEFGDKLLSNINRVEVENWLIDLPLANQTKNHILYSFGIILRDAELAGHIEANPLEKAEPMGKDARPRDVFTMAELGVLFPREAEELLKIWEYTRNAALFMILATTGIRSGEVRALRWNCVFGESSSLLITKAVKLDQQIGETKTEIDRVVLLPGRTKRLLETWHEETPYSSSDDLVFFSGNDPNRPMDRKILCKRLDKALQLAGIDLGERRLVPHSFRHLFNTLMKNLLPEPLLRKLTGHATEAMTTQYDHPQIEDLLHRVQGAREIIEGVWK